MKLLSRYSTITLNHRMEKFVLLKTQANKSVAALKLEIQFGIIKDYTSNFATVIIKVEGSSAT